MSVPTRVRLGAAVVAALAVAACGSNDSPKPASSPTAAPPVSGSASAAPTASASPSNASDFFESFDDNDNDWPTRTDSDGTKLAISGGEYRVTLPAGDIRYIRPAALANRDDLKSNVSITSTIRLLGGTNYSVGLGCRMNPADKQYYIGRVFGDGTSAIVRREKDKGEHILRSSRANPVKLEQGAPIQLVLLCGEKDGKMSLALSFNSKIAVQADDPDPLPDNPPGIYAVAGLKTPTSSFAFDDILVSQYKP